MKDTFKTTVVGHVQVYEGRGVDGPLLIDKKNQIHPKNMAIALARGLSNEENYQIYKLKLGNGGTYIDSAQQIVFRPPITTGDKANLYNPTYYEIVDEASADVGTGNSVKYSLVPGTTTTRVIVTAIVAANEAVNRKTDTADSATPPVGGATDPTLDPESEYFFDEMGLFTKGVTGKDLNEPGELMLTHLIFSPIESTGNRELTIIYSLIITVS